MSKNTATGAKTAKTTKPVKTNRTKKTKPVAAEKPLPEEKPVAETAAKAPNRAAKIVRTMLATAGAVALAGIVSVAAFFGVKPQERALARAAVSQQIDGTMFGDFQFDDILYSKADVDTLLERIKFLSEVDPTVGLTNGTIYIHGKVLHPLSVEADPHSGITNGTIYIHGRTLKPLLKESDPTVGLTNKTIYIHGNTLSPVIMVNNTPADANGNVNVQGGGGDEGYVHTNHTGNVKIKGSLSQGGDSSYAGYPVANGNGAHAEGYDTKATGTQSHAEGGWTEAAGSYSHAEGGSTKATGNNSHAEGSSSEASGLGSHAEGFTTEASNQYAHSEGYKTKATGKGSHSEGEEAKSDGTYCHAEGYKSTARGTYCHTEGQETETGSSSYASHAEGRYSKVLSAFCSHVEGTKNIIVSGPGEYTENAHAEGYNNLITNVVPLHSASMPSNNSNTSHVEGGSNKIVSSVACHAEGVSNQILPINTPTYGKRSMYCHAEGYKNKIVASSYSHVEGQANLITNAASTHVGGVQCYSNHDYTYVWNGHYGVYTPSDTYLYGDHGKGTFNINPENGINGFYIGNQTLKECIVDVVASMREAPALPKLDEEKEPEPKIVKEITIYLNADEKPIKKVEQITYILQDDE